MINPWPLLEISPVWLFQASTLNLNTCLPNLMNSLLANLIPPKSKVGLQHLCTGM